MAKYMATAASVALPPAYQDVAPDLGGAAFVGGDAGELGAAEDGAERRAIGRDS